MAAVRMRLFREWVRECDEEAFVAEHCTAATCENLARMYMNMLTELRILVTSTDAKDRAKAVRFFQMTPSKMYAMTRVVPRYTLLDFC